MASAQRVVADLYKDSVSLMVISAKLLGLEGIENASVVMATTTNLDNLEQAGLGRPPARPTDVVVAVSGPDASRCEEAVELAVDLLSGPSTTAGEGTAAAGSPPPPSIAAALEVLPRASLALVSVPGEYAAAEAHKALRLGLHVMIFSDNVPGHHEVALKREAATRGLLVMGPDCGTAIVNGYPLGFANVVRRGTIGVVGASGTGMQEITSRIHNCGAGVSQALGTGGHDLSVEVGGRSMLQAMRMLDADPGTEVVVLVSKPPAEEVAEVVLGEARRMTKPVVAVFLGADPASFAGGNLSGAATLADAADMAVALSRGESVAAPTRSPGGPPPPALELAVARLRDSQRYVRGVFCGGTFCSEAQLLLQAAGLPVAAESGGGHRVVDMGDDRFTQGRPHPMIDPLQRDQRVRQELADPLTAVLLVDVVLGHGSAQDPISGLLDSLAQGRAEARAAGAQPVVIAHVCGTDTDPQGRASIVAALAQHEVLVASSNAEATRWAAFAASRGAR